MALKYLKIGIFQFLRGAIDGDVAVIYNNTGRDYIVHVYTLGSEPTSLCSGGETIIWDRYSRGTNVWEKDMVPHRYIYGAT